MKVNLEISWLGKVVMLEGVEVEDDADKDTIVDNFTYDADVTVTNAETGEEII